MKKTLIIILVLFSFIGKAQTVELVKDINKTGGRPGQNGGNTSSKLVSLNGKVFYQMIDGIHHLYSGNLFVSDGTEAGTFIISETIYNPQLLTIYNNKVYFFGGEDNKGSLYSTDGTIAGTVKIKEFSELINPKEMVVCNGKLFISFQETAYSNYGGRFLWTSDGTTAGTNLLKDFGTGTLYELFSFGSTLIFTGSENNTDREIWKSDGTLSGTVLLKNLNGTSEWSQPTSYCTFNGHVYFYSNTGTPSLWKTDGTSSGTTIVKSSTSGYINSLFASTNFLLFVIGTDFWRSNGTNAGSSILTSNFVDIKEYAEYNGHVYFQARPNNINNLELYRTDGSTTGTTLFKELETGTIEFNPIGSSPRNLKVVGSKLYFIAESNNFSNNFKSFWGDDLTQLWVSDGTVTNTVPLNRYNSTSQMASLNGHCVFMGYDNKFGHELRKSDGTVSGTILVKNQNITTMSGATGTILLNNEMYFLGNDGETGSELWKSNGTEVGTQKVLDLAPNQPQYPGKIFEPSINAFLVYNNKIFFTAGISTTYLPATTSKIYISDGTAAGTTIFSPTGLPSNYNVTQLNKIGNWLVFNLQGVIYKTNLTNASTVNLPNYFNFYNAKIIGNKIIYIRELPLVYNTYEVVSLNIDTNTEEILFNDFFYEPRLHLDGNTLFINGWTNNENAKFHFFKSDGSLSGTTLISNDIYVEFENFTKFGNNYAFNANKNNNTNDDGPNAASDWGIYVLNNSSISLHKSLPKTLALAEYASNYKQLGNNKFNFTLQTFINGDLQDEQLFESNGLTNSIIKAFPLANYYGSGISYLYSDNNINYFSVTNISYSVNELWSTDGTSSGTTKVLDNIRAGTFFKIQNKNYFLAYNVSNSNKINLFSTDGSINGTIIEKENIINYNLPFWSIEQIIDNVVYVVYDDLKYGVELFKVTFLNPCPSTLAITTNYSSGTETPKASAVNGVITATNEITNTAKITYQARSMLLSPGFKAQPADGGYFKTEIGGCN